MKRSTKILVISVVLAVTGLYLLFLPTLWKERIEFYLNNKVLQQSGWQVSIQELEGHLLTSIRGANLLLTHPNKSMVLIPEFQASINIFGSVLKGIDLEKFYVNDMSIMPVYERSRPGLRKEFPDLSSVRDRLRIEDLWIRGRIITAVNDVPHIIKVGIQGALDSDKNSIELKIENLSFINTNNEQSIEIFNSTIQIKDREIYLAPLYGIMFSVPFSGNITYFPDSLKQVVGDIKVKDYTLVEQVLQDSLFGANLADLTIGTHFETDFKTYSGSVSLSNELGLGLSGDFTLQSEHDYIAVESINLTDDHTFLRAAGLYEFNGRLSGNLQLSQIDFSQWIIRSKPSDLSGIILFEGVVENNRLDDLSMTLELQDTKIYPDYPLSFSGTFSYKDSLLNLTEPLTLSFGSSSLIMDGNADFGSKKLALALELFNANELIINNFWSDTLKNGTVTGKIDITGDFGDPVLDIDLLYRDIHYQDFTLDYLGINAQLNYFLDKENGYAHVKFGSGNWKELKIDNGNIDLHFDPGKFTIDDLNIYGGSNYIQMSGYRESETDYVINRFQVAYDGHYLVTPKPLMFYYNKTNLQVEPFTAHVDDGIVEGYFKRYTVSTGRIKLSNVDSELLSYFIKDKRFHSRGIMFGELGTRESNGKQDYFIDLSLKNGVFAGQSFDDLIVSILVRDKILHIDELSLTKRNNTAVQVQGVLPLQTDYQKPIDTDLQCSFRNMDISLLTQFIPNWYHLEGLINGNFNLGGNTDRTTFEYDLVIADAVFDIITLGMVKGIGQYDGHRLQLSSFSSDLNSDHIEGLGFLPVDFNIGSKRFGKFYQDESLLLDVSSTRSNLDFLTAYLADVDSASGEFVLALQLRGKIEKIVRNGAITVKNGNIYATLLDDPITNIEGQAKIKSNRLTINSLTGRLFKPGKKKVAKQQKNLSVTGGIDLTKFFQPRFDINVIGKKIHFRTMLKEISGTADVNVVVTGKDTISITGEIAPIDVELYQEFVSPEISDSKLEKSRITMNYKLNFPIRDQFTLINSQIDAKLGGEVSITQFGDYPADFAGELYVQTGKFYYYGDIFTITDGYMAFDGKGFNPYLDISANTMIEDVKIFIFIVGSVDNPKLVLESKPTYSQSDILELLTWRKRFEDQEISSAGFGDQGMAILGSWLESQLERNFMQLSGLDQLGLVDDVSISGAGSWINPKGDEEFSIKADLSEKFSLNYAYKRSFSLTNPSKHMYGVELKVNRYMSLVGNMDDTGNLHVKYRLRYSY